MLTERQNLILKTIVEEFVSTALPVGSRVLSKKENLTFSAATIRNEMADLEEFGFIEKTHTSSGRIPSHKGYRYYVDYLVDKKINDPVIPEAFQFHTLITQKQIERETAVKEALKMLSSLTNYTSILLGPSRENNVVQKIQFVPLSESQAVLILITDGGHVESVTTTLPSGINIGLMENIIKALDKLLAGVRVADVESKLTEGFEYQLYEYISYKEEILYAMLKLLGQSMGNNTYMLSGKSNILKQPEFSNLDEISTLYEMIEEDQIIKVIDDATKETGLTVRIGTENEIKAMDNCTLITVPYQINAHEQGKIALLGPTRMEYQKIIPLLEYVAKIMSDLYKG
ncbi:MAG: heat-inducible transcriptional repressor HrcA [Defluviitaleaceae bacterium]|nr:heat-inducible transcriptional repressor HrcA [Defluviitaleaceae bacterium]